MKHEAKSNAKQGRSPVPNIRALGRIRYYDAAKKEFGDWQTIHAEDLTEECVLLQKKTKVWNIQLRRGGLLRVFPNMLSEPHRQEVSRAVEKECNKQLRQYPFRLGEEPRVHVLLSVNATEDEDKAQPGYLYRRSVKMKGLPLTNPVLKELESELAKNFNIPGEIWNIGVDVVLYRDGDDKIGFHADDTQGESTILCVVVDSPEKIRKVEVRSKRKSKQGEPIELQDGDEEIELFVGAGDSYEMDGKNQHKSHGV